MRGHGSAETIAQLYVNNTFAEAGTGPNNGKGGRDKCKAHQEIGRRRQLLRKNSHRTQTVIGQCQCRNASQDE